MVWPSLLGMTNSSLFVLCWHGVLRDEGEAYGDKLRAAGVPVTAVRYAGMIHDFVMLDTLRKTHAAEAAITQAAAFISAAVRST